MKLALLALLFSFSVWAKVTCNRFLSDISQVRFVPYVADGQLRGYVVHDLKKDSSIAASGIRELDLLTEIDSIKLTDESSLKKAIDGICTAGKRESRIVLLRSGKTLSFNIGLDLLPR